MTGNFFIIGAGVMEFILVFLIFIYSYSFQKRLQEGDFKKIFIFLTIALALWTFSSFLYVLKESLTFFYLIKEIREVGEILRYVSIITGAVMLIIVSKKMLKFSRSSGFDAD